MDELVFGLNDVWEQRGLLAQIAARLQARRSGEGGVNQEDIEGVVGDDNCMVS